MGRWPDPALMRPSALEGETAYLDWLIEQGAEKARLRQNQTTKIATIEWKHWKGDKHYRHAEVGGRFFATIAVRYGRRQKYVAGWNVTETDFPMGYVKAQVGKELLWRDVDKAVSEYLAGKGRP